MTRRRFSPTLVVAVLALAVALCGTTVVGYAAGKSSGNKIIKKHSLSGNRLKPDSVSGTQVDESTLGTVPVAARLVPGPLSPVSLNNLWVPYGDRPLGFRKDGAGFVHLQGAVSASSLAAPTVALTLPPGARPAGTIVVLAPANGTTARLTISASGTLVVDSSNITQISLESVTFFADQ
jgi:hypothetical protein